MNEVPQASTRVLKSPSNIACYVFFLNGIKFVAHGVEYTQTRFLYFLNSRKTIEQLEDERDGLLEQISAVDSKLNQAKDQRTCEDLANFAENKDWLQQQIAQEKAKHIELDAKVIYP